MAIIDKKRLTGELDIFRINSDLSASEIEKNYEKISFEQFQLFNLRENNYQNNAASKPVIELLQDLQKQLIEHNEHAATKEQLAKHDSDIKEELSKKIIELKNTIKEMEIYIEKSSISIRLRNISLNFILVSTILVLIDIFYGSIALQSPLPELALLISIVFYFISFGFTKKKK